MGRYGDADKTKLAKKRHDEGARKSTAIIKPYQAFNRGAEFQIEASRSAGFPPDLPHSPLPVSDLAHRTPWDGMYGVVGERAGQSRDASGAG